MKVDEIKSQFKDEWVLVDVSKVDKNGDAIEGTIIAHSKNRDDTYDAMKKAKTNHMAHFYTGEIPKKGYAVVFLWLS